jgi:hypothetical protein
MLLDEVDGSPSFSHVEAASSAEGFQLISSMRRAEFKKRLLNIIFRPIHYRTRLSQGCQHARVRHPAARWYRFFTVSINSDVVFCTHFLLGHTGESARLHEGTR